MRQIAETRIAKECISSVELLMTGETVYPLVYEIRYIEFYTALQEPRDIVGKEPF